MKKSSVLFVILSIVGQSWAYDFNSNGVFYNIISGVSPYKAEVTVGLGSSNNYSGNVVVPSSVTHNSINYTVTAIGTYAFNSCPDLISVTLPNTVTSIKSWAFMSCYNLANLTIPASVDTIGDGVFWGCQSFTSVNIPASVRKIGYYQFMGCKNLTQFTVDAANPYFSSVNGVLHNKRQTILVAYPPGKTENTYTVISTVDTIANSSFGSCDYLTSMTIPSTVLYVEGHTFIMCNNLSTVYFPASVAYFNNNPFYDCKSMTAVNIDPANPVIESVDGIVFKKGLETIIYYPPSKAGSSYTIPSTVKYVRSSAFMNCLNLNSISIPASVQTIRSGMLEGCANLTTINAYNPTPVDLTATTGDESKGVFKGVDTLHCVLHVPVGSRSLYANAFQWKGFTNIVEGFSSEIPSENTSTLKIIRQNGQLIVSGYTNGTMLTVHNLQGITVYHQKTHETSCAIYLPMHGIYILKAIDKCVKLVY